MIHLQYIWSFICLCSFQRNTIFLGKKKINVQRVAGKCTHLPFPHKTLKPWLLSFPKKITVGVWFNFIFGCLLNLKVTG